MMKPHSVTARLNTWFEYEIGPPTAVQAAAWPVVRRREHALLLASTGQGKTLAAWRPLLERLVESPASGVVRALHVAPLKALARDVCRNLSPLVEIGTRIAARPIRIDLRTGDTPAAQRNRQRRQPPEILCTTPESLFVMLGSAAGRRFLRDVEAVVIDELHALAESKRGVHLALSLARLDAMRGEPVQRIGLSATARPQEPLAALLTGGQPCRIVEPGPPMAVDLRIECPSMPLGPFAGAGHWQQVHERIAALAGAAEPAVGESMLVFCQTRAQVERSAAALDVLLADAGLPGQVGAHHGSLDSAHREKVESRFKQGDLRVLVSSASLELGLDLGRVGRVCQLGVPGSANLVRQRAGRSRHRPGQTPRMHLFALTRNQLIEAHALRAALASGRIEQTLQQAAADDVLAQHLVAMIAAGEGNTDRLLQTVRSSWPYRDLDFVELQAILTCLSDRPASMPSGQAQALVRNSSEMGWMADESAEALTRINAGTIPEFFEYEVICRDSGDVVGRLDEEFAFESSPGQVIQLGHRSWRILRVQTGRVSVEPVDDPPMALPFWFGEGRGRSPEMVEQLLAALQSDPPATMDPQVNEWLRESRQALGRLPAADCLVIEAFRDPGGDRHLVLHSFAGVRINRAWGLALRKRFCRQFNFELQAAATDDGILISLGVTSRFEPAEVARFVRADNVETVLTQALLDTPIFLTRFRWCANNALILLKNSLHGRVPAPLQRSQAENLVACVFPDQLACLENLSGPRTVPDHPLVRQALRDALETHMDLAGLRKLLSRIESGEIEVHAVEREAPSPLAEALIHAPRFSFLDEAAAEERRTRAFEGQASFSFQRRAPQPAPSVGRARGRAPNVDALEEWLNQVGFLSAAEGERGLGLVSPVPAGGWSLAFRQLLAQRRALAACGAPGGAWLWVTPARLAWLRVLQPKMTSRPWLPPALMPKVSPSREEAAEALLEARRSVEPEIDRARLCRWLGLEDAGGRARSGHSGSLSPTMAL